MTGVEDVYTHSYDLHLCSEDEGATVLVTAHAHFFRGEKPEWWEVREAECFDYGYALTVHKSQGSQWNHVAVIDESGAFRSDRWRWLYTAVTRAAERIDLALTTG